MSPRPACPQAARFLIFLWSSLGRTISFNSIARQLICGGCYLPPAIICLNSQVTHKSAPTTWGQASLNNPARQYLCPWPPQVNHKVKIRSRIIYQLSAVPFWNMPSCSRLQYAIGLLTVSREISDHVVPGGLPKPGPRTREASFQEKSANESLACPPEMPRLGGPPERSEGGEGHRMFYGFYTFD
ncbi:hypothetical protein C8R44DRAFT_732759 [Mycena epipterygia]|nr:hypothetical protein C8R44DRAFT_732759 [Mycena epipterygia]